MINICKKKALDFLYAYSNRVNSFEVRLTWAVESFAVQTLCSCFTQNTRSCITHFPASRENPNASQHPVEKPCGLHIFVDLTDWRFYGD